MNFSDPFQQAQADLDGANGDAKQIDAILEAVDAMLASSVGSLTITGNGDIRVTQDGTGRFVISAETIPASTTNPNTNTSITTIQ